MATLWLSTRGSLRHFRGVFFTGEFFGYIALPGHRGGSWTEEAERSQSHHQRYTGVLAGKHKPALIITASNKQKPFESWDVAGAFLKGLTHDKLSKRLRELGIKTVERVVAIVVPQRLATPWRDGPGTR